MRLALESGRPDEVDVLAARMSARSLMEWHAYFQAIHEIGAEAILALPSAPTLSDADAPLAPPVRPRFMPLDEASLRAKFRAHNARLAGAA